ncbi:hypothetical protein J2787_004636 [Chryseobacterium rhizosphaerae]|uniref:Uncharacterized protein n=1 Tax=Chryseobacterium rhizosphaerae TaxID=395937 RepID=A0AAE3YEX6_9FLAO|nr:hypothetical protein [Chryseobacterium rhizosphaerae]
MWLKFVKGLSSKENCKFLFIKLLILLYEKDRFLFDNGLFFKRIAYRIILPEVQIGCD